MKVFQVPFQGINGVTGTDAYEVLQLVTSLLSPGDVMTSAVVIASTSAPFPVGALVFPGHLSALFALPGTIGAQGIMFDHTDLSNTTILATFQRG
jgi:hypothetical protein